MTRTATSHQDKRMKGKSLKMRMPRMKQDMRERKTLMQTKEVIGKKVKMSIRQ